MESREMHTLSLVIVLSTTPPGRQIQWEPGNQVPTKFLSSSDVFGRIHALLPIIRVSVTEGYELKEMITCDRN